MTVLWRRCWLGLLMVVLASGCENGGGGPFALASLYVSCVSCAESCSAHLPSVPLTSVEGPQGLWDLTDRTEPAVRHRVSVPLGIAWRPAVDPLEVEITVKVAVATTARPGTKLRVWNTSGEDTAGRLELGEVPSRAFPVPDDDGRVWRTFDLTLDPAVAGACASCEARVVQLDVEVDKRGGSSVFELLEVAIVPELTHRGEAPPGEMGWGDLTLETLPTRSFEDWPAPGTPGDTAGFDTGTDGLDDTGFDTAEGDTWDTAG
ncbi:MAG: hypothetical protein KC656_02750 [Myxococcales bacterium]|nr:hypothetical protein [Myxococcales bacterium]